MERVNIYLRTPLFSFGAADHIPDGVTIIEGHLVERDAASVRIEADHLRDERGRALPTDPVVHVLVLPWEKIDHMLVIA